MNNVPLWTLSDDSIEYGDKYHYHSWNDFINDEPWNSNDICGAIPTYWKVYHPDDSDFEDEYDTLSLGLVYTTLAPLRAISVFVQLNSNDYDETIILNWLIDHKFYCQRGG